MISEWSIMTLVNAGALAYGSLLYLDHYPFSRSIPEALAYEEGGTRACNGP